ncbi:hypothetical protein [Phytohabitans rumicis]|uniref:hypothetical protein n=1 Tax=Phytohabitans rumicis TaxID=1076125 RepID=UPI0015672A05|nr:hypothetical protein [Phytohabitans rumicis]
MNSASFAGSPLARGALLTAFGSGGSFLLPGSPSQSYSFPSWPTNAGGVQVYINNCTLSTGKYLPILYVSPTQINFYLPNSFDPAREVFGTCAGSTPGTSFTSTFTITSQDGTTASTTLTTTTFRPGVFFEPGTNKAQGLHYDAWTGALTDLRSCNGSNCPVYGEYAPTSNRIAVLTTGGEGASCGGPRAACTNGFFSGVGFRLGGSQQRLLYHGPPGDNPYSYLNPPGTTLGQDVAIIDITLGTAGTYTLQMTYNGAVTGNTTNVVLGPPN